MLASSLRALVLVGLVALPCELPAQGSRQDYERAARLREQTRRTVFRSTVVPHWLPDGNRFWYRIETGPGQHEFVLVNADAGTRTPAFDHARLAESLARATQQDVNATRLPFRSIAFEEHTSAIRFTAFDQSWRFDLSSNRLERVEDAGEVINSLPKRQRASPSRRTGEETQVVFRNATANPVRLFWISPDGERRPYGIVPADQSHAQHTYAGHVWVVESENGRLLGVFEATAEPAEAVIDGTIPNETVSPIRRAGESPDGRWRAVLRNHNVVLQDLRSGEEFALTDDGSAADRYERPFHWSPDSSRLVVLQVRRSDERTIPLIEAAPRDQLQPKLHSITYPKPGDPRPHPRPRLFDVEQRRRIDIAEEFFPNPWSLTHVHWWPDCRGFTFLYNERGHQVLRIVEVDASTGAARALVDEQSQTFIDYAHKQFVKILDSTGEILWMSERDGWNHLYLYDAATGQVKNQITRGEWVVRGVDHVDEERRQIWFRAGGLRPGQDPYYVHYARINFDGSDLVILTEGNGTHEVEYSPDRRFLIDTWSRVDQPPVCELRRADDGSLVCELERADWSRLLATGWRSPEPFVAKGRDGTTDIYGVIYRPSRFDPEQRYPVIEHIYAGPQGAFVPKRFAAWHAPQSLAELGFILVQIDGMGTSHRSKAFHDVCWKNLGDSGFPDRIAWMQAAAARYPWMDLSRVGIYGGSAGGQSALRALLAHGDFYKAAAADCGCHDNRLDKIWWNELWMGWPVGPHYAEQSNVTQAHKLQGKLLLTVGAMDRNVDPASTMQVVDALIKADKDFELVVFPSGGHGSGESPYGQRRRQDFFVRHLLGVEPRWESAAVSEKSR